MVAGMGRSLWHAAAWVLATSAAVTLSWFGVHTVLNGTEYDPPRTLPLSGGASASDPAPSPSKKPPKPSPSRTSHPPSQTQKPNPPKSRPSSDDERPDPPDETHPPSSQAPDGEVRGVSITGGRAVFDMGQESATLVSATPEGGWDTRVYKDSTWIRVTFSNEGTESSVFCRWDDGPPRIETYTRSQFQQ